MTHSCAPECTAGWGPSRKCHCSACGNDFSCPAHFDKHKPGDCLSPESIGLVQNQHGVWIKEGERDTTTRLPGKATA